MAGLLVVTAVAAERDAVLAADPLLDVIVGGVGPAAAAAATATALGTRRPALVLSAGIGGGFVPAVVGTVVVASTIVFADLGAETAEGFVDASAAGFGVTDYGVDTEVASELARRCGALLAPILTVATVTGTSATAAALQQRFPDARAEAMEGAGVAAAARLHQVPYAEVRAVSNLVGPRERSNWRVADALDALGRAVAAIAAQPVDLW